jgi:SAM-dependent methyltransferase
MVQSKEWNWAQVTEAIWSEPSEDIYYYLHRWKHKGFQQFLDLGCGLGRHSLLFAQNGFETDSLDLSQDGLDILNARATEQGLKIKTRLGDINQLPYRDESFDCLLAYHLISHTDTQGIVKIVSEIHRVLREGGEFYGSLCSKNSSNYQSKNCPRVDENTILKTEEPEVGVPHFYSNLDDVRRIFQEFKLLRMRHVEDIFEQGNSWHYFIHAMR